MLRLSLEDLAAEAGVSAATIQNFEVGRHEPREDTLMRIQAAGDDHGIFNGVCGAESGWVPVSATSPSLFLGQIETALKDKGNEKPPVLDAPRFDAFPDDRSPVVARGDSALEESAR